MVFSYVVSVIASRPFRCCVLALPPSLLGTNLGAVEVADRFGGAVFTLPVHMSGDNDKDRLATVVAANGFSC